MDTYVAYAARGRTAWWRYLLTPLLGLLLTTLTMLVGAGALTLMRLLPPGLAAEMQQPTHFVPFYLGIAVTFGLLAAGVALAAFLVQRKRPSDIIGQWRWRLCIQAFAIWIGVQVLLALIDFAIAPTGFALSVNSGTVAMAGTALAGILVQTFAEEFIFRGYLTQGLLLALKKPLPAAIISGILFGSLHIPNGTAQALNATVFGIVCALIAIRTGGIALTFGLHLANNYFGAAIVVSGSDVFKGSPGIIAQATPQLLWWDVGIGTLALIALLCLILRRPYFAAAPAG